MRTLSLIIALTTGIPALAESPATAPTDSAMSIAQSGPSELVQEVKAVSDRNATVQFGYPENLKSGCSYSATWKTGDYTAEIWFSKNFTGSKANLTTVGGKGFRIDWDMQVYGFLHQVGLYDLSIEADSIKENAKASYSHELNDITGGGGYTGFYGWLGDVGKPDAVEFYINENWAGGPINMSDCVKMGSIEVDGGTYEIYTRPRKGNRFVQWWSNRTTPRTSGEISYAKHIQAWLKLGMPNGSLVRLTFCLEVKWGHPSSGSVVYKTFAIDKPSAR